MIDQETLKLREPKKVKAFLVMAVTLYTLETLTSSCVHVLEVQS